MHELLIIAMYISGILTVGSVMLMSPKGGLGIGLGGVQSSNEYGSKKSIEATLKKVAFVASAIFLLIVLFLPYIK